MTPPHSSTLSLHDALPILRIIPAQFVKPYVKSNKNDAIDAAAIAEAVTRPTMRFVQVKHHEQVELQFLHRSRELLVDRKSVGEGRRGDVSGSRISSMKGRG